MSDDPYKLPEPNPLKQLVLSFFAACAVGAITYVIADQMAKPGTAVGTVQTANAYKFVYYVTALASGVAFALTMTIYKKWADRQYAKSLEAPRARVVSDKRD